jgi:Glycosyl hydrolase family 53
VMDLLKTPEAARVAWLQAHLWPHLARMFSAVAGGIRSVDPNARFSSHVSGITAVVPAQGVAFYRAMADGGFVPEELGFSFYPSSSDRPPHRLEAFQKTALETHKALGRPIFIAEFGYPAGPVAEGMFASWNHALDGYPLTEKGQAGLLEDLVAWSPTAGVCGIRPWGPELAVPGWAPFALFSPNGKTAAGRPGLRALASGLTGGKKSLR